MIRHKKKTSPIKEKGQDKTTIPRRSKHNSEKLGELALYILNRFENLDTAAIIQEDAKKRE